MRDGKRGIILGASVKIDAYVLPDDHKVYKFFPGKSYKFYEVVRDTKLAIIDVRNLDELGDDPDEWDDDDVLDHISQDRVDRAVAKGKKRPARLVNSQGDKATQTFLEGLLFKARKGDLIAMPDKGYTTNVLIGRLLDEPGVLKTIEAHDGDDIHTYYGRRVKWVGAVEKRLFDTDLINLLHSQAAFFDIGRGHYQQVYNAAFDNFIYDKQFVATYRTSKRIFTPKDNFLTSVWLELLEVLEEAREAGEKLSAGTIYDLVIQSDIDDDDRDDLSISIQSPGWFRIRSAVASPLASLALFAMAYQGVPYKDAVAATTTASVVLDKNNECLGDVDASVRDYIKLLGKDRWEQACTLAKQAGDIATLEAEVQVKLVARKEEN